MKNLRTLREEIILALGSFADNVKISLYEDKFYIVECDGWSRFNKCGKLLGFLGIVLYNIDVKRLTIS